MFKVTPETFIERVKAVHGDKYDYSNTVYVDIRTKVKLICSEHGEFSQRPDAILKYTGCPKCALEYLEKTQYRAVIKYDKKGNMLERYRSIKKAAEINDIDRSSILACCKYRLKSAGGFVWKYVL